MLLFDLPALSMRLCMLTLLWHTLPSKTTFGMPAHSASVSCLSSEKSNGGVKPMGSAPPQRSPALSLCR
jgi:hypothetical protein